MKIIAKPEFGPNGSEDQPLVSILMPVFNSSDPLKLEGFEVLSKAIDSLLNQTYKNLELIIIDNQSSDDTPDICKAYAAKDSRIRYILDNQRRMTEDTHNYYASLVQGKYCMMACDDDLWNPDYIKKILDFLELHPEIDMAYSNGNYVTIDGSLSDTILLSTNDTYRETGSPLSNYCNYIMKRNVIPMVFGIFKTEAFHRTLPFVHVDTLCADVDNLFIAKFFLLGQKCHYIDECLFFYRMKSRRLEQINERYDPKAPDMPALDEPLLIWLYYVRHQFYFYNKLIELSQYQELTEHQQCYIKCVTLDSCFNQSFSLLNGIGNDYIKKGDDKRIYSKTINFFKNELKPLLLNQANIGRFPDDSQNNIRFQPPVLARFLDSSLQKITIFSRLIEYFSSLLDKPEKPDLIRDIQELLQIEIIKLEKEKVLIDSELGKTPEILIKNSDKTDEYTAIRNENPKLSIISCSMNLGRFLEETILSVARQSSKDYEHIVIDGGSTDETLEILKRYPHIKWISEKDSGYNEALKKGLAIAKGKYIMQCSVSDGYIDRDWFKRCIAVLDSDIEVSLVWGFPQYLTEDSKLGDISYPQYYHLIPPQKYGWLAYWLKTKNGFPEGNFCVRREIFDKCLPANNDVTIDSFVELNYNFNLRGYLPYHIPVVANFGRTHENASGQMRTKSGFEQTSMKAHYKKVRHYYWKLLTGNATHIYRDGTHNILPVKFSTKELQIWHISFIKDTLIDLTLEYIPYPLLVKLVKVKASILPKKGGNVSDHPM